MDAPTIGILLLSQLAIAAACCRFFNVIDPLQPAAGEHKFPMPPATPPNARYVAPEDQMTDWYPPDAEYKPARIGGYITRRNPNNPATVNGRILPSSGQRHRCLTTFATSLTRR